MIIDDQPLLTKWLSEVFSDETYLISQTANADDIREDISTFIPDIILLDIHFDGFERWDILHRIKLEFHDIPVLIMGTYDNFAHDPRVAEADGYVIKDIYTDKLESKMVELLNP